MAREMVARGDSVWKEDAARLAAEPSEGSQVDGEGSESDAMGGLEDGDGEGWTKEQVSALQVIDLI